MSGGLTFTRATGCPGAARLGERGVFVVDSSFFPTGFGLNPMVTVMANALRVGTWIADQDRRRADLDRPLEQIQAP